jgi:hypothetical protein
VLVLLLYRRGDWIGHQFPNLDGLVGWLAECVGEEGGECTNLWMYV